MEGKELLVIGDSRVESLKFWEDLKKFHGTVHAIKGGRYEDLRKEVEEQLNQQKFDALVFVGLQNDLTNLERCKDGVENMMIMNNDFNGDVMVMQMKKDEDMWKKSHPQLIIMWTLPYVPDFIRYNEVRNGGPLPITLFQQFQSFGKHYETSVCHVKNLMRNHHMLFLDLNVIIPHNHHQHQQEVSWKDLFSQPFINPPATLDGLHPSHHTGKSFLHHVERLLKLYDQMGMVEGCCEDVPEVEEEMGELTTSSSTKTVLYVGDTPVFQHLSSDELHNNSALESKVKAEIERKVDKEKNKPVYSSRGDSKANTADTSKDVGETKAFDALKYASKAGAVDTSKGDHMTKTVATSQDVCTTKTVATSQDVCTTKTVATSQDVCTTKTVATLQDVCATKTIATSQDVCATKTVATSQDVCATKTVATSQDVCATKTVATSQDVCATKTVATSQDVCATKTVATSQDVCATKTVATSQDVCATKTVATSQDVCATKTVATSQDVCATKTVATSQDVCATKTVATSQDVCATKTVATSQDVCATKTVATSQDVCATKTVATSQDVCATKTVETSQDVCATKTVETSQVKDPSENIENIGETMAVDTSKDVDVTKAVDTSNVVSKTNIGEASRDIIETNTANASNDVSKTKAVDTSKDKRAVIELPNKKPNNSSDAFTKSTNQEPSKEKQNRIPGRSFIIGIRPFPSEGKKTMFDCVLCWNSKEKCSVNGSVIIQHIKTKEHALKVMEIENYDLYNLYKDDTTTATEGIVTAILNYEETQKKQSLVLATTENYSQKREIVRKQVEHLKQIGTQKARLISTSNNSEMKGKDLPKVLTPNEKEEINEEENAERQKGHTSKQILEEKKMDIMIMPQKHDSTEPLFEKVVIVGNCVYKKILNNFAGLKVEILADEDFKYDCFESVIKNKVKEMPPKTLWLTLIGSFCIFEINKCESCQHFDHPCANPLTSLVPSSDVHHLADALETIKKIHKSCLALMKEVRMHLKPESAILIIPPFPLTVYSEDMFFHSTLHSLYSDDLQCYVASENIINHLGTVFTHLSKEMISLTVEELEKMNYPQKPILDYESSLSDSHMHIVRDVTEPKEYYFNEWKKAISKLILQFLNERAGTKMDSSKELEEIVASIASKTREIKKVCEKYGISSKGTGSKCKENGANRSKYNENKANNTKYNESKASGSSPKVITIDNEQYDHLAFIGCQEQLQQLPTFEKSNISLWNLKFPLDWNDMRTKFASLESLAKKKKLFVILGDISMIAMEIYDSQCKVLKCKNLMLYMTAETSSLSALIEEKIESIKRLASQIKSHFPEGTKVILAPLCPRYCIEKPVTVDEKLHRDLHEALEHDSKPCILEGTKDTWEKAVLEFRMGWENEVHSTLTNSDGKIKDLIKNYILKLNPLLEWKKPEKSSLNFNSLADVYCRLFFINLMETVVPSRKQKDEPQQKQQQQQQQQQNQQQQQQQQQLQQEQTYTWQQQQQQPPPNSHLSDPLMSTVNNFQNSQMPLGMQHPPVAMQYNTYQMQNQQPNVYMNSSYGMYGMNLPYQQQQQQYTNQNFPPPSLTYSQQQQQQQQMPFHNYQSPQNNPAYSTQVTYEAAAMTCTKSQESPTLNQPNIANKIKNGHTSVAIPLPSISNASATKTLKSRTEENTSSSIAIREAEATQVFIDSLPELCNIVNKPNNSTFDHVFIIGKKELIHPLSELKLENATLIYHNLSSVVEKDIPFLLNKIGNIPKKSVCFLAFSLSVITKTISVSPSCRKFSCKQPIPVSNLKSQMEDSVPRPNSNIIKRIKELVIFTSKMSDYVPAVVLPLFPSRVFCDDSETLSKHRISHAISNCDSHVVMGKKEDWEGNFVFFTYLWNNFIKVNHNKYISSELISKYTQVQKNTLIIKEHVNDFFTDYSDPTHWRAFLHILLHTLVTNSGVDALVNLGNKQRQRENTAFQQKGGSRSSKPAETKLSSLLAAHTLSVPVLVKVWNSSQSVPYGFFNNFFKTIESKAVLRKVEDYYSAEISRRSADLIVKKLNNCQIGDATIKACIVGKEDEAVSLTEVQENYVSSIFNQLYHRWKFTIIENIKESLSKELEISKFKTKPCNVQCKGEIDKCTFYHNEYDRRRNLTSHSYIQKMCPHPKTALNLCKDGDSCVFSHNIYEQMFYPTNFQTILCPTLAGNKCLKQPFCKFAHKNTPEMFYVGAWQDMAVFGVHNTFKFFAGALKGISKLHSKKDVKVCLISPSTELLDIARKAIVDILKDHQLKAIYLGRKWINPDFYQVFLGTPSIIANFQGQILSTKSVGALIVDDISSILETPKDRDSLLKICQKLKITSKNSSVINKVVVATHYDPKITGVVSRFLGVPLTEVKETEGVKLPSANDATGAVIRGGQEKTDHEIPNRSFPIKDRLPPVRDRNDGRNSRSSRSRSRSRSWSRHRSRSWSRGRKSRSSSKSHQKRSRSPSHSKMMQKKLKVDSPKPDTMLGTELANVAPPQLKTKITTAKLQEAGSKSLSSNLSLGQKRGEKLYKIFLGTEKALYSKHEDEYEVFKTYPELHSDYEVHYEEFASEYFRRYGTQQGEKHKEHFWSEYWKVKFKDVKEEDWKKKREELVKEYEEKAKSLGFHKEKERPVSVVPFAVTTSASKFSVEGTLNLLEQLSDKLGMLGPAIVAIVNSAKEFGVNNNKALSVFTDAENLVLVSMVIDKLTALQNTAPKTLTPILVRALDWIKQLLDHAKNPPKELGLNLEAIAKASVGKDPAFILNLIKTALAYEGLSPVSEEEINGLYLKICSLHFHMAMEGK